MSTLRRKVLFFANTDWYLYNFRLPLAKYLREHGCEVVMVSPSGDYGSLLEAEGFKWIGLNMRRRSLNPLRELGLIARIGRIYASEKPDLVHHFTIKCVVYGSLIARWCGISRQINAVTGLGYVFSDNGYKARLLRPLVKRLMRAALAGRGSRLILQNHDDAAAFAGARLAAEDRTYVIRGSGVDTSRFSPAAPAESRPGMRVLLASRMLWDKGIREYVEAARLVRLRNVPVEFLLAGAPDEGNPGSVSLEQIRQWQRSPGVTYLGKITDMPRLLREVDVAVLPSYREGVPRSLLEAAACGLPIVTTDAPGCREIVRDGVNGLLVPLRNAAALAEAICYMYERPGERQRMGVAGREQVLQHFDERMVLDYTFAVYRELFAEPSRHDIAARTA